MANPGFPTGDDIVKVPPCIDDENSASEIINVYGSVREGVRLPIGPEPYAWSVYVSTSPYSVLSIPNICPSVFGTGTPVIVPSVAVIDPDVSDVISNCSLKTSFTDIFGLL